MGLFEKFKEGLKKTQDTLWQNVKSVVPFSMRIDNASLEELELALIASDLGATVTQEILEEVKAAKDDDLFSSAQRVIERSLKQSDPSLITNPNGLTVISVVGVNGTGKTTSTAKLAYQLKNQGKSVLLGACDTFRAAAIDQLKLWGQRLDIEVVAGQYGADPAAIAHDSVSAALKKKAGFLIIDTAGRLHTKINLMNELQKIHRVMDKQLPGAPHEVLLVLDATTGSNALNQARQFNEAVKLSGLVVTKLDGTSKGGMVVAIQRELKIPVKFIGVGEQPDDLQPFEAHAFAAALCGTQA